MLHVEHHIVTNIMAAAAAAASCCTHRFTGCQCAILWSKYLYSSTARLTDPLFVQHINMVNGFNSTETHVHTDVTVRFKTAVSFFKLFF